MGLFTRTVSESTTAVKSLQDAFLALEGRVALLEKIVGRVADDLGDLEKRHLKLRGVVYAHKLHKPPAEEVEDDDKPKLRDNMTRDELRKSLVESGRWVPGRPAKHES